MTIFKNKEKLITNGKKIAKQGVFLSLAVFVISLPASALANNGTAVSIFGDIRVFSFLFFALSLISLFLIQMEVWEKDQI